MGVKLSSSDKEGSSSCSCDEGHGFTPSGSKHEGKLAFEVPCHISQLFFPERAGFTTLAEGGRVARPRVG